MFNDKSILITGGTGSLGHAFVPMTLAKYNPRRLVIYLRDEYRYKILKRLETEPEISQRELAKELGISLGKVNYCLKALIEKGWVKANNFRNNQNKKAYIYFLTPRGGEEKSRVTVQFLKFKVAEYEALKGEVENLQREAAQIQASKSRIDSEDRGAMTFTDGYVLQIIASRSFGKNDYVEGCK